MVVISSSEPELHQSGSKSTDALENHDHKATRSSNTSTFYTHISAGKLQEADTIGTKYTKGGWLYRVQICNCITPQHI